MHLFDQGYRYALKADFRRFFDTVDHRLLQDRLEAYLDDPPMVELIMRWVRHGVAGSDCGLPIGHPFSPVLSNLFLDSFDEESTWEGGWSGTPTIS